MTLLQNQTVDNSTLSAQFYDVHPGEYNISVRYFSNKIFTF